MELGQIVFGNKWEEIEAPEFMGEGLYALSEALGKRDPERQAHGFLGGAWGYGQDFENGTFSMFPYYWGDCACDEDQEHEEGCLVLKPNFLHKPSSLAVHWYKYIGRGMTTNKEVSAEEWHKIMAECHKSISVPG